MRNKDRPFAEGIRGCHALLRLDAQNLNAKERHFILPLVIWTFIMQFVAFISLPSQDHTKLIFPYNKRLNIFRIIFYCLMHRWKITWRILLNPYVGMVDSQNMNLGLRFLDAQVVSLHSANFWLAKILDKHHMLEDLW